MKSGLMSRAAYSQKTKKTPTAPVRTTFGCAFSHDMVWARRPGRTGWAWRRRGGALTTEPAGEDCGSPGDGARIGEGRARRDRPGRSREENPGRASAGPGAG